MDTQTVPARFYESESMPDKLDLVRDDMLRAVRDLKDDHRIEFAEIKSKQDLTNGKVRALEVWKARATGVITGLGLVGMAPGLVLAVLTLLDRI